MRLIAALILSALLAAAVGAPSARADSFGKFYRSALTTPLPSLAKDAEIAVLPSYGDLATNTLAMMQQGYELVGASSFQAGKDFKARSAFKQARKVGATHIIFDSKLVSKEDRTYTYSIPKTVTTQTTGDVQGSTGGRYDIYGRYQPRRPYGGGYTETTRTTVQEQHTGSYTVSTYRTEAQFFAPMPRSGLGAMLRPVNSEEAQRRGSNAGLVVLVVRRGSPSFMADMLAGDVITKFNGKPAYDADPIADAALVGGDLSFEIDRNGTTVTKVVSIAPGGSW